MSRHHAAYTLYRRWISKHYPAVGRLLSVETLTEEAIWKKHDKLLPEFASKIAKSKKVKIP